MAILIPGKRFYRQPLPSEPVFIAPQWRKDFAYAVIGNRQMVVPGLVGGRFGTQKNYAVVPSRFGTLMGRKFAANGGGDTLSLDTFTANATGDVQPSYLAIVYPQSPQNYSSIIDHADKSGLQMVGGSGLNVRRVQGGGVGYNNTFSPEPTLTNNAVNVIVATARSVGGASLVGNHRIVVNNALFWNTVADYANYGNAIGGASTLGKNWYSSDRNWAGTIPLVVCWNRSLTDGEMYALSYDPWQVFVTRSFYSGRAVFFTAAAAGGTTHTTTGALTGPGSTVAGTAAHLTLHTSTGVLTGPGSAVAGTAAHQHATAGALTGPGSTVAGTAAHQHATTGVLTGAGSTVVGSADHTVPGTSHSTSGVLAGVGSTVAGTAAHLTLHTTTGVLTGPGSTVAGTAAHQHASTGVLTGAGSTVSGTATRLALHTTTGILTGAGSTVVGSAARNLVPSIVEHYVHGWPVSSSGAVIVRIVP